MRLCVQVLMTNCHPLPASSVGTLHHSSPRTCIGPDRATGLGNLTQPVQSPVICFLSSGLVKILCSRVEWFTLLTRGYVKFRHVECISKQVIEWFVLLSVYQQPHRQSGCT